MLNAQKKEAAAIHFINNIIRKERSAHAVLVDPPKSWYFKQMNPHQKSPNIGDKMGKFWGYWDSIHRYSKSFCF